MSEQNLAFLSFDGGGVRGLSSLYILKQIMITIARDLKLKDPPKPCEYFNLIGGTSTGGLIAIMLGRLQMDIDSCIRAYMNMSETIFKKKSSLPIDYRLRLRSRFDAKILEKCFKRIITSQGLEEDALLRDDTGDEHCKTFVCAIEQSTSKLVGFSSYSSRRDDSRLSVIKIWEAARATSAATSYFDPICINYNGIKEAFLDGGMVANNPIHELWSEGSEIYGAKSLQDNIKCVLSIGTGVPYIKPFTNSLIELPETLVRLATDADKAAETFQRLHQNLDKKDKYFRLTVPQGLETVEVEDYAQLEKIRTLTMSFLTKQDTHKKVNLCAQVLLKSQGKLQKNALALRDESTIQKFGKIRAIRLSPVASCMRTEQFPPRESLRIDAYFSQKISKYDHQRTHKRLVRKKLPGTTQWFLDHPSFQAWVGGSGCNTLWCSGIIGSGKTTIAASVVEYLMHQAQRTGAATIYFYCEAEQRDQCRGTDLLASFIRQLLTYMSIIHKPCPPGIQGSIQRYYGRKESVPDWDDLVDVFVGLSRCVSGATYVIDGLDEFPETDILNILRFVEAQPSGAGYQSMKILLLSRDKVAGPYLDIGRFISEVTRIATGQHNDDDIRSYITITIQHKSSQLRELTANSTLMNEVESRLFSGALGM
ncbi:MAG: hypothetical protein M1814_005452 [Vezdaea aestivalis]|nr:MAG: hypothetical protein M1814_005452 [Vezdaea aestivalis]